LNSTCRRSGRTCPGRTPWLLCVGCREGERPTWRLRDRLAVEEPAAELAAGPPRPPALSARGVLVRSRSSYPARTAATLRPGSLAPHPQCHAFSLAA
jgi:hypothetical protein